MQASLAQNRLGVEIVSRAQRQMMLAAAVQRCERILKDQLALADDADVVGHLVDLRQQMAGNNHRHAEALRQFLDELAHFLDACRI